MLTVPFRTERNGLVAFTLHHETVLEWSEKLLLASGNGVYDIIVIITNNDGKTF